MPGIAVPLTAGFEVQAIGAIRSGFIGVLFTCQRITTYPRLNSTSTRMSCANSGKVNRKRSASRLVEIHEVVPRLVHFGDDRPAREAVGSEQRAEWIIVRAGRRG